MNTASLRRRGFGSKSEPKLVFDYTLENPNILVPKAYDAETGYFEVDSFPDSWTEDVGVYKSVYCPIHGENITTQTIPWKRLSFTVQLAKVDSTHCVLKHDGDRFNDSVSTSGTYNLDNFHFEWDIPTYVEILNLNKILGHRIRMEVSNVCDAIQRYGRYYLNSEINSPVTAKILHYDGNNYNAGIRLGSFTIEFTISLNGVLSDGIIISNIMHNTGIGTYSTISVSNVELLYSNFSGSNNYQNEVTLDNVEHLYLIGSFLNGSNIKIYILD